MASPEADSSVRERGDGPSAAEMHALRSAVGISLLEHVVVLRIDGPGAFALLDRLSTAPLYLRDGEIRQTLLLNEAGVPVADASIASDQDGYFLLADGLAEAELLDYVERYGRSLPGREGPAGVASGEATVTSLGQSHQLWSLNGPYAWELASLVLGPSVVGMTYMTTYRPPAGGPAEEIVCFRNGKTGEYGYDLLVPRHRAAALGTSLFQHGDRVGCARVELPALNQAALENWQFNMRTLRAFRGLSRLTASTSPGEGEPDDVGGCESIVTPIELQLQWRVGYDRGFLGAEALRRRREQGSAAVRLTCFTAADAVTAGEEILWGDEVIGRVFASGWSHLRGDQVGAAFIRTKLAHPGIDRFAARTARGTRVAIRTRTPPLLNNRSLYVDQHRHSYATRATDTFPSLVAQ